MTVEVLLGAGGLALIGLLAAWLARQRRIPLPKLRRKLGGVVLDGWLVLSDGLRLRRAANGRLEAQARVRTPGRVSVRTTPSGLRATGNPDLVAIARQAVSGVESLSLADRWMHVVASGGTPRRFAERVRALVAVLEEPWLEAWSSAGQARGLSLTADRLSGELDELSVEVFVEDGQTHIRVEGDLRDVTAAHKDVDIPDAAPTGNAVLDMTLRVRQGEGPLEDQVVETMLPVLHAFPGSMLNDGRVLMRIPGTVVEGIGDRIDEALALARAVKR